MDKKKLRKNKIYERNKLSKNFVWIAGKSILSNLVSLEAFKDSHTVMAYMSYRNEVPTPDMAQSILLSGKTLVLPFTDDNFIIYPYIIKNMDQLKLSSLGIYEPDIEKAILADPDSIDMIIVPGVAFDLAGNRLGFGKGCYDRFLPVLRSDCLIVGLSYEFQLIANVPTSEFDMPMDIIITEKRIIRFR